MIKSKRILGSARIEQNQKVFSKHGRGRFVSGMSPRSSVRQKTFSYTVIDPNMVMSFGQSARALVADIGQVGAFSQPLKALIKKLVNVRQLWKANVNTLALIISLTGKFYESMIADQIGGSRMNGKHTETSGVTEDDLEASYNEEEGLGEEELQEESDDLTEKVETAAILARTFFTFLFSSVMSVIIKREMLRAGVTGPVSAKQAFIIVNKTISKMGMARFLSSEARPYFKDLRFVFAMYVATSGAEGDFLSKPENLMRFYRGQMFYTRFIDEIVNLIVEERTAKIAEKQNSKNMKNKTYTNPILRSYYEDIENEDVEVLQVEDSDLESQYRQELYEEVDDVDELEDLEDLEDIEEDIEDLEQDLEDEDEDVYEHSFKDEDDEELEEIMADVEYYESELDEEDDLGYEAEEKMPHEMTDEEFAETFQEIEPRREAYIYASRLLSRNNRFFSSRSLVNRIVEDLSRFFSEEEKEEAKDSLQVVIDRAEAQELVDDFKELVAKLSELLLREEEAKIAEQRVEDEEEESEEEESPWWQEEDDEEVEEAEEESEEEMEDEEESEEETEEESEEEEKSQSKRSFSFRNSRDMFYAKKKASKRMAEFSDDEDDEEETVKSKYMKRMKQKRYNSGLMPTRDNDAMDEVKRNLRKSKLEYQKSIRQELKDRKRYMQIPDEDKYLKPSKKSKI